MAVMRLSAQPLPERIDQMQHAHALAFDDGFCRPAPDVEHGGGRAHGSHAPDQHGQADAAGNDGCGNEVAVVVVVRLGFGRVDGAGLLRGAKPVHAAPPVGSGRADTRMEPCCSIAATMAAQALLASVV